MTKYLNMKKESKNLYIRIAKFAANSHEGFSATELKDALNLNEWEVRIVDEYIRNALMNGNYNGAEIGMQSTLDTMFFAIERGETAKFIIKYDAYFNYMDYLELQAAKQTSIDANKNANKALCWVVITFISTIILTLISIGVSFHQANKQINNPTTLNEKQFNEMINTIQNQRNQFKKY